VQDAIPPPPTPVIEPAGLTKIRQVAGPAAVTKPGLVQQQPAPKGQDVVITAQPPAPAPAKFPVGSIPVAPTGPQISVPPVAEWKNSATGRSYATKTDREPRPGQPCRITQELAPPPEDGPRLHPSVARPPLGQFSFLKQYLVNARQWPDLTQPAPTPPTNRSPLEPTPPERRLTEANFPSGPALTPSTQPAGELPLPVTPTREAVVPFARQGPPLPQQLPEEVAAPPAPRAGLGAPQ